MEFSFEKVFAKKRYLKAHGSEFTASIVNLIHPLLRNNYLFYLLQ